MIYKLNWPFHLVLVVLPYLAFYLFEYEVWKKKGNKGWINFRITGGHYINILKNGYFWITFILWNVFIFLPIF